MLPTIDTIDDLWAEYWREQVWQNHLGAGAYVPLHKVLRFGQYVYNQIGYETDSSYYMGDSTAAYNNIRDVINFKSASLA